MGMEDQTAAFEESTEGIAAAGNAAGFMTVPRVIFTFACQACERAGRYRGDSGIHA